MVSARTTPLTYRPELNGMRALAVWAVVLQHWASPEFAISTVGRQLLFVLSGYLIAAILWKEQAYPGAHTGWPRRLGVFYLRRMLRITPAYYCALALSVLLPLETVREHLLWFVLPIANHLFYTLHHWGEGCGHFWTLAVDEQFYFIWPFVLGVVGRRIGWLYVLGVAGLLFRLGWCLWVTPGFVLVFLPSSLELFVAGSLLRHFEQAVWLRRWATGSVVLGAWVLWGLLWLLTHNQISWLVLSPLVGAGAGFLTLGWLLCYPAAARRLGLLHPALLWMGERSFGVYLYHLLLPVFYQRLVYKVFAAGSGWRETLLAPWPMLLVLMPLLVVMSAASWRFLEAPLNRLKRHLPYRLTASPRLERAW